jgi:hypothetical protein
MHIKWEGIGRDHVQPFGRQDVPRKLLLAEGKICSVSCRSWGVQTSVTWTLSSLGHGVFAEDLVVQLDPQAGLVRWCSHGAVRKDLDRLFDEIVP